MPTSQQQKAAIAAAARKAKTHLPHPGGQSALPVIPSDSIVGKLLSGQPITQNHELDTTDVNTLLAPYSVLNANDPASAALQTSHFGNAANGDLVGYVGTASLAENVSSSLTASPSVPSPSFRRLIDVSAIKTFLQANSSAGRDPSKTYHFQYALHKQNNTVNAQGNITDQTGSHFTLLDIAVTSNNEISIINYDTMEDVTGDSIISREALAEIKDAVAEGFGIPPTATTPQQAASSQPAFHFSATDPIQSKLRAPSDCLPGDMQQNESAGGFSCGFRVAMQVISAVGSDTDKAEVGGLRTQMLTAHAASHLQSSAAATQASVHNYKHIPAVTQWAAQRLMFDALRQYGELSDATIKADDLEMPVDASDNIMFNAASTATSAPPPPLTTTTPLSSTVAQPQQVQSPPPPSSSSTAASPTSAPPPLTTPAPPPTPTVTTNEDGFPTLEADKKKILEAAFNAAWLKRLGEALTTEELKKNKVTVALSMRYPKAIDGKDKKNEQNIKIEGQSCTLYMKAEYTTPATQGNPLTGAKDTPEKTETVNIALTRTQGKDGKVEWTCIFGDSKKVDWALSCRMIAEASLAMRCEHYKAKTLGDGVIPEAIKLELKKDVLDKADEKTKKPRTEDFCNGAELTDKEFALIKAHFDAGYKYVEYAGLVYDKVSPNVRSVQVATEQKQLALQTHCAPRASAHYTADGTNTKSLFLPLKMTYHDKTNNPNGMSATEQARTILDNVRVLKEKGYREVGITYSANQEETAALLAYYADTKNPKEAAFPRLGTNQGAVMKEVLRLLAEDKYHDLEPAFKIIPLTTMKYDAQGNVAVAEESSVTASIQNAQHFMQASNHALLGWQNQSTRTLPADFYSQPNQTAEAAKLGTKYFAVGGGIASTAGLNSNLEHQEQMARIQDKLLERAYHNGVALTPTPVAFDAMDQLTRTMVNVAQTLEFVSHLPKYNDSSGKTYIQQTQGCKTSVQYNLNAVTTQLQTDILTAQHTLQNMKDRQSAVAPDKILEDQIKELTQKITDAEGQMKTVSDACQEKIKELEAASQNIIAAEEKIGIAIGVLQEVIQTVSNAISVDAIADAMNDVRDAAAIFQPIQAARDAIAAVPQALQSALMAQISQQETLLQNAGTNRTIIILTLQAVTALETAADHVRQAQTVDEVKKAADVTQPPIASLFAAASSAIYDERQKTPKSSTSQIDWLQRKQECIATAQSALQAAVDRKTQEIERINTLIADATQKVKTFTEQVNTIIVRQAEPLPELNTDLAVLRDRLGLLMKHIQEMKNAMSQTLLSVTQEISSKSSSTSLSIAQTALTNLQTQITTLQQFIQTVIASTQTKQGEITSTIQRLETEDAAARAKAEAEAKAEAKAKAEAEARALLVQGWRKTVASVSEKPDSGTTPPVQTTEKKTSLSSSSIVTVASTPVSFDASHEQRLARIAEYIQSLPKGFDKAEKLYNGKSYNDLNSALLTAAKDKRQKSQKGSAYENAISALEAFVEQHKELTNNSIQSKPPPSP